MDHTYTPTTGADALKALNTLKGTEIPEHDNGSTLNDNEFIEAAPRPLADTIASTAETLKDYMFDNAGKVKARSITHLRRNGYDAREVADPDDPYTSYVQIDLPDGEHNLIIDAARAER